MIIFPVRCEQACANQIVIRDFADRIVAEINTNSSHLSHEMWEDAKQIVRALNASMPMPVKPKKEKQKCS
jgi:hypothetical protein